MNPSNSMADPHAPQEREGDAEIDLLLHEHAPTEDIDLEDAHQSSLLVLSRNPSVIDAIRRAAPRGSRVADAFNVDMAADKMAKIRPAVLVADKDVVPDISALAAQFTQHFPDLVVIVAGQREDSSALMQLTATGQIHRFLLLPLSHGQTRLALDAAVKRHFELVSAGTRATAVNAAGIARKNYLPAYAGLAIGIVLALAGIWWAVGRMMGTDPSLVATSKPAVLPTLVTPRVDALQTELARAKLAFDQQHYITPVENNALDLYRSVLVKDSGNEAAQQGLRSIADKMLERAEAALLEERMDDAVAALATARSIRADHPRLAFMDAQVARERDRHSLSQAKDTATKALRSLEDRVADERARAKAIAEAERARQALPSTAPAPVQLSGEQTQKSATSVPSSAPAKDAATPAVPTDDMVALSTLKRTRMVTPSYPENARSKGIQGWVDLELRVMPDGKVSDIKVQNSTPTDVFDQAAIKAVRQWRFEPPMKDGKAVPQRTMVRLKFTM
jgi:TonB family protein